MSTRHPYPGLRPFQMEEGDIFFGRGVQIDQMLHKLETHRFLAVVGASGSGKSSLVRAGLLPALRDGFLSGAAGAWRFVVFRPGDAPFCNLALALHQSDPEGKAVAPQEVALTAATLTASDRELVEAVRDLGIPDDTHVLVLVDQFEEIFRYRRLAEKAATADGTSLYAIRDAATAFVNQLLATARQTERTIYVVLTMRSDFLGDCDAFLGLPEAINDGQFLVPRLNREQLRATIVEPLRAFGARAEASLVETLLNDTGSDPDQLPLLQHTLLRLWLMRSGPSPLSLQCYRDPCIGGMQNSLCNHADEALYSLRPPQQRIAEKMFRGLCDLDNEGKWTRRWMKLDEIAAVAGLGCDGWAQVAPVAEAFIREDRNFLLASPEGPFRADTTIDISHESLIRQWRRMQDWLKKEQESVQQFRRLLDTARLWKAGQAGLWGSPDLDVVLKWRDAERPSPAWAKRCGGEFELTEEFLQACVAAREQQRQEAEQRRQDREREVAAQKAQLEALQKKEAERNELQKTRRGRAELMLAERAELWNARPEFRRLPNLWEYLNIRLLAGTFNRTEAQRRMMRAANRHHAIQAGVVGAALLLIWWGSSELTGRFQAAALHERLFDAEITQVPDIIKSMAPYRRGLEPELKRDYDDAVAKKDRRKQLYASLARLPSDPSQAPVVFELLFKAHAYEVEVICKLLTPHKDVLLEKLWLKAEQAEQGDGKPRLYAAGALAAFDPGSPRWSKLQDQVARDMIGEPGVLLSYWVQALDPVRDKLRGPLSHLFRDPALSETERSLATEVLKQYAEDQPEALAELLLDADEKQFASLFEALQKHGTGGLGPLEKALPKKGGTVSTLTSVRLRDARRQANGAVALLRLGRGEDVWPLLGYETDPTLRTYLIHRLGPLGADAKMVLDRFEAETDLKVRRALVQSLGVRGAKSIAGPQRDTLIAKLQGMVASNDDPGLHASAEWLLRHWGQGPWLKTQIEAWRKDKTRRDDQFNAVLKKLTPHAQPQWYVNGQGMTMVVLPGPIEFTMGSPESETDRAASGRRQEAETLRSVLIDRTFAVAATHVTIEQYRRYFPEHEATKSFFDSEDCPVQNVDWARAAHYCVWLSDQEGIPEKEWCYEFLTDKKGVTEPRLKADYLNRTGYRLPTEAEYEYACRAHAATSRHFGDDRELLSKYAWHLGNSNLKTRPVASLKPNDFGLFDMHGNVSIWCQNLASDKKTSARERDDADDNLKIARNKERATRGGSFLLLDKAIRCAASGLTYPDTALGNLGFRVVRTIRTSK